MDCLYDPACAPPSLKRESALQHWRRRLGAWSRRWRRPVSRAPLLGAEAAHEPEPFATFADALPALIWTLAPDGTPDFINRSLAEWMGVAGEDLERRPRRELAGLLCTAVHPDDMEAVTERIGHALASGQGMALRYRHQRLDGRYGPVEVRLAPLRDPVGRIVRWYGLARDIDQELQDRRALERSRERLQRASQLVSLSAVSASIAHEINQPLAAIMANAQACLRRLDGDRSDLATARGLAERVVRDVEAAAAVVQRVRALFGGGATGVAPHDITEVIRETTALFEQQPQPPFAYIVHDLPSNLPPVRIDRVQIQQLLLNLMRNGMEAMDDMCEARLEIQARRADGFVHVEVRDHGCGPPPSEAAFEPFFTTKAQGMGLGLAICRSIALAHGGALRAEAADPGVRMALVLPLLD